MQGVPIRFKALKPKGTDFEPRTLGEHLRKRRLLLGLTQKHVGKSLELSPFTVLNLEKARTKPPKRTLPRILSWLGYDPFPTPKSLQERMAAVLRINGWTTFQAARELGIDPATWGQWERSRKVAWPRYREKLESFLAKQLAD